MVGERGQESEGAGHDGLPGAQSGALPVALPGALPDTPTRTGATGGDVVLVVDAANVVGARPDGWWRDRAGAARRLLDQLGRLPGRTVRGADGTAVRVVVVAVVLEGRARAARGTASEDPPGLLVLLADASGDDAVVDLVAHLGEELGAEEAEAVVVTADRGLRARLPGRTWGPGWLRDLLDALDATGG